MKFTTESGSQYELTSRAEFEDFWKVGDLTRDSDHGIFSVTNMVERENVKEYPSIMWKNDPTVGEPFHFLTAENRYTMTSLVASVDA